MKPWIKRTLIGVFGASVLVRRPGRLLAPRHHGYGWQAMSEEDAAKMKATMVDTVGSRLDLDEAQKAKLGVLADTLREQRNALVGSTTDPRAEMQSLVAGPTFDRAKAQSAGRGEDRRHQQQEPRGDRRAGRLLRQPEARAAGQGARVHERRGRGWRGGRRLSRHSTMRPCAACC